MMHRSALNDCGLGVVLLFCMVAIPRMLLFLSRQPPATIPQLFERQEMS